jgi:hypothetical protein
LARSEPPSSFQWRSCHPCKSPVRCHVGIYLVTRESRRARIPEEVRMRRGVALILFALTTVFPPGISAQIEGPSWARDSEPADFPVEVAAIIFTNGIVVDGMHPSMSLGRWQISRSGPLIERLTDAQYPPCSSPYRNGCFQAYIEPFKCYNSSAPTLTYCTMVLSWSPADEARCEIIVASSLPLEEAREVTRLRISCPAAIHFVK